MLKSGYVDVGTLFFLLVIVSVLGALGLWFFPPVILIALVRYRSKVETVLEAIKRGIKEQHEHAENFRFSESELRDMLNLIKAYDKSLGVRGAIKRKVQTSGVSINKDGSISVRSALGKKLKAGLEETNSRLNKIRGEFYSIAGKPGRMFKYYEDCLNTRAGRFCEFYGQLRLAKAAMLLFPLWGLFYSFPYSQAFGRGASLAGAFKSFLGGVEEFIKYPYLLVKYGPSVALDKYNLALMIILCMVYIVVLFFVDTKIVERGMKYLAANLELSFKDSNLFHLGMNDEELISAWLRATASEPSNAPAGDRQKPEPRILLLPYKKGF